MGVHALVNSVTSVIVSEGGSEDVQMVRSLVDGPGLRPLVFLMSRNPQKWHRLLPFAQNQSHFVNQSSTAV